MTELIASLLYAACYRLRTTRYAAIRGITLWQAKHELTEVEVICLQVCDAMTPEERALWLS